MVDHPPEPAASTPSDFERLGAEGGLRAIITDFVGRTFGDVMIGFLFQGKPQQRITEMEYRFAAEHLGGPVVYNGRPLGSAHGKSPIMGGHFARRRQILIDTLADHQAPPDVVERWIAHVDALAEVILGKGVDARGCDHTTTVQPPAFTMRSGAKNLLDRGAWPPKDG